MTGDGTPIGERLKRVRREHAMTQEDLAAASGVSRDLIAKLEQGRRTTARISTLSRLARGLDCEIGELVDKRERLGADRDGGSVLAVRDVLLSPALLPGLDADDIGEPTPVDELERQVGAGWRAYWCGDFGGLLAMLPGIIGEARATHAVVGGEAVRPLALAYELASQLMTQIGRTDLGMVAAERAVVTAHGGGDDLLWAWMHAAYSWVLFHQGRFAEAEDLAASMANRVEPSFRGDELQIGVWGVLLSSTVAPTVAMERDPGEALSLARAGAERLGRRVPVFYGSFAPATVAMQGAYGYSTLGEPAKALEAARRIKPGDLEGISWGAHLVDVARAHLDSGHRKAATRTLLEARSVSPVWFRHQRVARSVTVEIRDQERRLSPETRTLVKALSLDD